MVGFVFVFVFVFTFLLGIVAFVWSCLSFWSSSPRDHGKPIPKVLLGDHFKNGLPNDLLVDILKRLPAEDLLRYQLVCREWNSLISTPNFHHMHLNYASAVPTIVVKMSKPNQVKCEISFLDDQCYGILRKVKKRVRCIISSSKNMNKIMYYSDSWLYCKFSYHGLMLFARDPYTIFNPITGKQIRPYTIFNPITREQVTFQYEGLISAFFFHPVAKVYYALACKSSYEQDNYVAEWKLLTLSSLLSNNHDSGKKLSISVPNIIPWASPLIQRDAIYWMAGEDYHLRGYNTPASCEKAIVIFDIKEEEFYLISHPGGDTTCWGHDRMRLFEKEGLVSIGDFSFNENYKVTMHIWDLLEEYSWSPRETIILEMKPYIPLTYPDWSTHLEPIGTVNGELIICWYNFGVFAYNLQLRTLRKLKYHDWNSCLFIHTKTILSLKSLLQKAQNCDALDTWT